MDGQGFRKHGESIMERPGSEPTLHQPLSMRDTDVRAKYFVYTSVCVVLRVEVWC